MNKVLLLGIDGATFSILDPMFSEGHMPNLQRLLRRGASGVLTSTIPPYTPPGWTSIFTGVNPGKHGIFGFRLGNVQRDDGLVRLDRVKAPAIWNVVNSQGGRIGLFNVPMTFPPPVVEGFAVSGMLTPEGGGGTPDTFTYPESLAQTIGDQIPDYEIDIEVDYDHDWRSTDIEERLSRNLQRKRTALRILLEQNDVDMLFPVFEAPDRIMHVHYKYIDPRCEHYQRSEAGPIRERVWAFFDEMDDMIGDLVEWAGDDGFIVTMSDHGFGPKDKSVNINLALREWGLLSLGGAGTVSKSAGLRKIARRAKKAVPKSVFKRVKGAAQSRIDWANTKAFSAPIPQQGLYINLEGREPHGVVPERDYEAVRDEVIGRLTELMDPDDGKPVVDHVYRREEVLSGPSSPDAPDLFPVCRAYSYELSDGLYSPAVLDDYRDLPRGFHAIDGIFGVAGPGIPSAEGLEASLYDVAPTALYLGGWALPAGLDGRVLDELLPGFTERNPVETKDMSLALAGEGAEASPYSQEEEAQIEESLKNLGYL